MLKRNRLVKTLIIFIVISLLIQAIFFFFLSKEGLSIIYPHIIKSSSTTVETGNVSSIEYYGITNKIKEADILSLDINLNLNLSYEALFDYINFINQNRTIKYIVLPMQPIFVSIGNSCITAGNSNDFNKYLKNFQDNYEVSDQFCEFMKKIYKLNASIPMTRQIRFTSDTIDVKSIISNMVMSCVHNSGGSIPEELSDITSGNPDICFKYIDTNPEALMSFLGKNYDEFTRMAEYYYDGVLENILLLEKIYNSSEGKVSLIISDNIDSLILIPDDLKIFSLNTKYYNCSYKENDEKIELNTIPISGVDKEEIRFVSESDISRFRNFYNFISSPFNRKNNDLDDTNLNFFIICNSGELTYADIN